VLKLNNKQLEYAIELSKSLNFSTTAEKLKISQPALSKHISNLEKELGTILFDRRKNPIELTAAGEYFFREVKDVLFREKQLYRSMADFNSEVRGNLTIGISPFRSLYFIHEVLSKINEKYPKVKIILREYSSDILRENAAEGNYDFAIVNLPVDESVFDIYPLEKETLVLAVPEKLASSLPGTYKKMSEIDFKYCENLPFIAVSPTQEMRKIYEKMCAEAEIVPNIVMEVVGLNTAWTMVRSGIGATLLPVKFVESTSYKEDVRFYIPKGDITNRRPAVIMKHGQHLPEYAKYAIELLTGKPVR